MNRFFTVIFRNKISRSFWQVFKYIFSLPLYSLGYLIPKDPSIWVFANVFGYKDNARYLFEFTNDKCPDIKAIWVSSHKQERVESNRKHFTRFSCKGIWLQYRAGVVFVSTGQSDVASFCLARTKIIQLWHGIPIKNILLDSQETFPFKSLSPLIHKISLAFLKKNLRNYSLILASSQQVQLRLASAFGVPENKVVITGYPRHDIIYEEAKHRKKWILYAPTWRNRLNDAQSIVMSICNTDILSQISKLGYEFWLSIHPLNEELLFDLKNLQGINIVGDDQDINFILAQSEILITDYSSVAIDFSFLNRKIIFYTPDLDEYLLGRGLYEEFETIINENGVKTSEQVIEKLIDNNQYSCVSSEAFFKFRDNNSRQRIIDQVRKINIDNKITGDEDVS